ncbi:MAG: GvpL/GvpF family gas vesicle protein [Gemmatimonadota bacterium]|nr:GvpL/GvpF family gas vesicle protein [Gemmatimonadota bacterium]
MGFELFGVASLPERNGAPLAAQTLTIPVRDLAAIVRQVPYAPVRQIEGEIANYERVVEAVFTQHTILPAPFGVVFRSVDQVSRWLQMHYIALTEGMHLIEGRCEARVHVMQAVVAEGEAPDPEADLSAAAGELFRSLRRQAAASVMLRRFNPELTLSCAFLVDRARWDDFAELVATQARRHDGLRLEHTGPWPPYDFVRMDLGV